MPDVRALQVERAAQRLGLPAAMGGLDGRSRAATAYKQAIEELCSDLGGEDALSRLQLELVRRVAGVSVLCAQIEAKVCSGEDVEVESYTNLIGALGRTARALGLKRVLRDLTPPDPLDYARAREREAAA